MQCACMHAKQFIAKKINEAFLNRYFEGEER